MKRRIAIDFDGTIHKYSRGFADGTIYDEPIEGAKELLTELSKDYQLIIFTARTNLGDIGRWMYKHDIPYDEITNNKPPAMAYIDDRAIHFESWDKTREELKKWNLL